jgi:hypothetical protein
MSKEPIEGGKIVALASMPRNVPQNWRPPAPACATSFANQTTPIVMAYFGTQIARGARSRGARVLRQCGRAPEFRERALCGPPWINELDYRGLLD